MDPVLLLACGHGPATTSTCVSVGVDMGRRLSNECCIGMWYWPAMPQPPQGGLLRTFDGLVDRPQKRAFSAPTIQLRKSSSSSFAVLQARLHRGVHGCRSSDLALVASTFVAAKYTIEVRLVLARIEGWTQEER